MTAAIAAAAERRHPGAEAHRSAIPPRSGRRGAAGRRAMTAAVRSAATASLLLGLLACPCRAGQVVHFDPDADPSRLVWADIARALGPAPDLQGQRFGIVIKTPTNEYWRQMAAGYRRRAAADGVKLDLQAAQSEDDPVRQLALMENMVGSGYKAMLISPQSALNLQSAIEDATTAGVPLVDIDGAVVDSVAHFVGPVNRDAGASVARWFIRHVPAGGKVAVIEGQAGVYSTVQRSAGFRQTLAATGRFDVLAGVSGQWDRRLAYDAAVTLLKQHGDLVGIYCNNDTMALGAVEAVKALHRLDRVKVFGTDGTRGAYASIMAGELAGTVDIFPGLTGEIGLDVAERLSAGQTVPRVVETAQALVTRDNASRYLGGDDDLRRALMEDAAHRE